MTTVIVLLLILCLILLVYMITPLRETFEDLVNSIMDSNFNNIERVQSDVDKLEYYVQSDYMDKNDAANMIAELNNIVLHFIKYLKHKHPNDPRIMRLASRYNPNKIMEGNPINNKDSTSYSIAKGKKVVFCVRSKNTKKIHDKNLLLFVVIHELSHIMSISYGHNTEFMNNFKFLLNEAINAGIYKKENYFTDPREYCGMQVTTMPL